MTSNENTSKYKMNHAKRGIALIININKYDPNPNKHKEREWSIKKLKTWPKLLQTQKKFRVDPWDDQVKKINFPQVQKMLSFLITAFPAISQQIWSAPTGTDRYRPAENRYRPAPDSARWVLLNYWKTMLKITIQTFFFHYNVYLC